MSKPVPRRVPSDDYRTVDMDGNESYPHEGEWVEVVPGPESVAEMRALLVMTDPMRSADNNVVDAVFQDMCEAIAGRITGWNWTTPAGFPRPQPDGGSARIAALTPGEIYYLRRVCAGEAPAERKNGSGPTPTISSAGSTDEKPEPDPSPGKVSSALSAGSSATVFPA